MNFFGSSLAIKDNLKVAFFGKIYSQKIIVQFLYLVIKMTD